MSLLANTQSDSLIENETGVLVAPFFANAAARTSPKLTIVSLAPVSNEHAASTMRPVKFTVPPLTVTGAGAAAHTEAEQNASAAAVGNTAFILMVIN
ncbi:hypothetical protein LL965_21905 [Xanthomonas cassavae CFBP 4642]|uniref:Uncharacterized protein n=1 Tax=Xanthomonas cassavae CFBP 4642 TaxID=1219375 RepID=A0ABS8HMM4_9XANT|nr:hypothetical protein [Xanthomonas cassavae]MCC4622566.1 hypothetical protein [Xanthomonas cassavae CFBP 4642]